MTFLSSLFGQRNIIYIHTDKQEYYSGELVCGQVFVCVAEPTHIDAVYIILSGLEKTAFNVYETESTYDSKGNRGTKQVTRRISDENTFFRRRYCLFSMKSTLSVGNFVFPFQFHLDANLPGTFELNRWHDSNTDARASVYYQVEAEIAVPGILTPNLRHNQELLIREPLREALMSTETHKESKVTFLCCIPKGCISMSATIDKNAYGPGDKVMLRLIVDNSQSQVNLDALSLKLVRSINIKGRGQYCSASTTIAKATTPGLVAGDRTDRTILLDLPRTAEPSTTSPLVECNYKLSVQLKVPWSPDVVINQPVQIYALQRPTYVAQLSYPSDWNPTVYPIANLENMQQVGFPPTS